jgi:hypothetical protein
MTPCARKPASASGSCNSAMTDKAYLLQTLREDFPQCYDGAAPAEMIFWHPPNLFLKHLAMQYAAENLLPKKLQAEAGLFSDEAQELADILRREETERFLTKFTDAGLSERVAAFHADCVKEQLTEERVAWLLMKYRCRDDEVEPDGPDDADFIKHVGLNGAALEFIRMISRAVRNMDLRTEPPESDFEKRKRLARETRREEQRKAQERERIASLPVEELKARDIEQIDDVEKLSRILRSSEDDRAVKAALDRIYRLREDDIEIVRACLPGKCTWALLRFLCEQERETPYRYLTLNHFVREIVPALQREGHPAATDLLDSLHYRKYRRYINRERGRELDYWDALAQFNAATTPAEAFRNIDPDDYDLWYEFDDSDEMSYINSLHTVPFSIGGYDLHRYRLERLCEADLLTDED